MKSDSEISKKSKWAEVTGPAREIAMSVGHVDGQLRGLMDMPSKVPTGAKEIALVTIVAKEQNFSFKPVMEALKVLEALPDWSESFLVADEKTPLQGFSWKRQPFRKYQSFADFYERELASTWGAWSELKSTYDDILAGKITEEEGKRLVLGKNGRNQYSPGFGDDSKPVTYGGITNEYIEARLQRDRPDLYAKVKTNQLSHNAAAIEAGFRKKTKPRTPLQRLRSDWKKASDEERQTFLKEINP